MKIALGQINTFVGDVKGNAAKIIEYIDRAKENDCELIVFPELALTGYPPRDLLQRSDFVKAVHEALVSILPHTREIGVILGTVTPVPASKKLYNSAVLLYDGRITARADKSKLTDLLSFEESRYFEPSAGTKCLDFRGMKLAVTIGQDIWSSAAHSEVAGYTASREDVLDNLYYESPDIYINLSAMPYRYNNYKTTMDALGDIARRCRTPFICTNMVGGNDELIFAGSSAIFDSEGVLTAYGRAFEEDLVVFDTKAMRLQTPAPEESISWLYDALVLGFKDYFRKTGFKRTLLGLSGGIDSALVACIAVDALGKENVLGVSMPSRYSSEHSKDDARDLADNLGIEYRVMPIEKPFAEYIRLMNGSENAVGDLAEENIQARIRGNILMYISNREGMMLVSTSNKSEAAVGYSTMYGDMCGGLAVIADVPKTMVYKLCNFINRDEERIPVNTIVKPPSAELRPDQLDQDSLPPYEILDEIVRMYLDDNLSIDDIVSRGFDREITARILNMIDRVEYKRRQAAPMLKVTSSPYGIGRKVPINQGFRWS